MIGKIMLLLAALGGIVQPAAGETIVKMGWGAPVISGAATPCTGMMQLPVAVSMSTLAVT